MSVIKANVKTEQRDKNKKRDYTTRVEVSTLKNAKLCKIGVECVEFM